MTARLDIGAVVRSLPKRWRALEKRVERALTLTQTGVRRAAAARTWRPRWWGRALAWWAASPIRSAIGWWLVALDGCLEVLPAHRPATRTIPRNST